jgi:hypothetical protein
MVRILWVVVFAFLSGCASVDRLPTDYAGPDAGKIVIGIGAASGTGYSSYTLLFRPLAESTPVQTPRSEGRLIYAPGSLLFTQKPDYSTNTEQGVVLVKSLPAGRYELFNFSVFLNGGMVQNHYSSKSPVSIPFSVSRGQTTYLGNYQANGISGKNAFGLPVSAGAVFAVSNRADTDLALAKLKDAAVTSTGENATPSVERIANPFFVDPK